jgi:hypothetical protein
MLYLILGAIEYNPFIVFVMQRRRRKSYEISVNREDGYILVNLYGELTKADIDAALKEILTIRQQEKLNNILCNQHQLQMPPRIMTVFDTACRFAEAPFNGMKLAIVRQSMPEKMHFFETAATNRARAVKVFDNDEEAKKWLAL